MTILFVGLIFSSFSFAFLYDTYNLVLYHVAKLSAVLNDSQWQSLGQEIIFHFTVIMFLRLEYPVEVALDRNVSKYCYRFPNSVIYSVIIAGRRGEIGCYVGCIQKRT